MVTETTVRQDLEALPVLAQRAWDGYPRNARLGSGDDQAGESELEVVLDEIQVRVETVLAFCREQRRLALEEVER